MSRTINATNNSKKVKEKSFSDVTVRDAIKGEKGALQTLCEKIARDVLFRATFICGNQIDAEDISQEALIRVCTNIQKLRNPVYFRSWLSRIVLNEARRHFEKNSIRHFSSIKYFNMLCQHALIRTSEYGGKITGR